MSLEGQLQARQKLDTSLFSVPFPDTPVEWRSLPPFHRRKLTLRQVKEPAQGQPAENNWQSGICFFLINTITFYLYESYTNPFSVDS